MNPAFAVPRSPSRPLSPSSLFVGTAAWALPPTVRDRFPPGSSLLERYAGVLNAVEVNATFKATPRPSTFARWAASVPAHFRFSLKLPRRITHVLRLREARTPLVEFVHATEALADRRGPLLVQLPPSLTFDRDVVESFLGTLRQLTPGPDALEPRHPSWFSPEATALLAAYQVARVAADPPRAPGDGMPGGAPELAYFRLHGSPRVYYSDYSDDELVLWAGRITQAARSAGQVWCIFDNTAAGLATGNALSLSRMLAGGADDAPGDRRSGGSTPG